MYAPGSTPYWFARCPIKYVGDPKSFLNEAVEQNCSYDEQPFASQKSLHAIHYLLFLIGISRILAIVSLVYASHTKLKLWDEDLKRIRVRQHARVRAPCDAIADTDRV